MTRQGFSLPALGNFGTAPRRFFHGPGLNNWNLALHKDTLIREGMTLQIRAEFFNLLNRANFSPPNRTVFAGTGAAVPLPTAGQITSTATPARQIQFALRLLF